MLIKGTSWTLDRLTLAAGDMPHRIAILAPTKTGRDTYGTEQLNEPPLLRCWAKIEPTIGRELMVGPEVAAISSHTVEMRYRKGVVPGMLVQFGARNFQINFAENVLERNVKLVLYCTEGVSNP